MCGFIKKTLAKALAQASKANLIAPFNQLILVTAGMCVSSENVFKSFVHFLPDS